MTDHVSTEDLINAVSLTSHVYENFVIRMKSKDLILKEANRVRILQELLQDTDVIEMLAGRLNQIRGQIKSKPDSWMDFT